jgi:hypothetical protein
MTATPRTPRRGLSPGLKAGRRARVLTSLGANDVAGDVALPGHRSLVPLLALAMITATGGTNSATTDITTAAVVEYR